LALCGPEDRTLAHGLSWRRGGKTLQIMFDYFYSGIQCSDSWFEGSGHVVRGGISRGLGDNLSWFEGSGHVVRGGISRGLREVLERKKPAKADFSLAQDQVPVVLKDCWLLFYNNRRDKMKTFTFGSSWNGG